MEGVVGLAFEDVDVLPVVEDLRVRLFVEPDPPETSLLLGVSPNLGDEVGVLLLLEKMGEAVWASACPEGGNATVDRFDLGEEREPISIAPVEWSIEAE